MSIGASGGTITSPGNIAFATGQAIRTGVGGSNSLLVQAYDTDGIAYTTFFTLTANTTPTLSVDQPLSWADGVKQTFNPSGTNAGINLGSQAGDPSSLANGDMWYDSTSHLYRVRINSASATLATIATSQTFTNKTLSTGVAVSQPLTWGSGVRQTFSPDSITPGVNLGSFAGDPSTPSNGDMWYNSTTNKFRCYQGGAAADCISAGGAAPGSNKQVIYNNSGTSAGATGFEYQSGSSPNVSISAQSTSHTPLNVNGLTSQTAPIQAWQLNGSTRTVIGEDARSIYLGNGRTSATGTTGIVSGTEAVGANLGGSGLTLQGGAGTGSAVSGSVVIRTAPAGAAPSTLNSYVTAMEIDGKSNIELGSGLNTTTSTEGFVYIQSVAGLPTGVPGTAYSGTTPTLIDSTNRGFCMYVSGWNCVRPVGGSNMQLLYNNNGYSGGVSGATSNGSIVSFTSASLAAVSPSITTSLTTPSTTFALVNTTASTVNFAGAATTLTIGSAASTILNFGSGTTTSAEFRFLEGTNNGTSYVGLKAPASLAGNTTYTFPGADGASGDVLSTNSSGTLSWVTPTPVTPPGTIVMYGGASAPSGWLLCDGSAVTRSGANTNLFNVICPSGTCVYGSGDGSSTFNLPDLRQRFPLGRAASGTGSTLGGTGGAIDHTHTSAAHTHGATGLTTSASGANVEGSSGFGTVSSDTSHTHAITGSTASTTPGATGSNNPPFQVVNYIIKQ
jgi:microcystin-dependent protein